MTIYSLYILNKAGGLIYQQDYNPGLLKLSANDYLVLAGTIHGVHAIASKITPFSLRDDSAAAGQSLLNTNSFLNHPLPVNYTSNKTGLNFIQTDFFNIYLFQSLTGIKFILVTSPNGVLSNNLTNAELILRKIYIIFSDYVMKNPFYNLEMPIRCELFDLKTTQLLKPV
ncbi:TRAPP subunit TRS23 [Ascoidea rubescens DSM 1968]|uniref:Trafficking protein particle complex subunit n=1 Tax=Ascoidea rubescens DSM 1968 TaxID=1344418 RepID=A0A1D2VNC7_9ASCO|nr:Sybindin-like protein [Ascoidea rubescens DSM 1968]ODV63110.1 Sybindin-like protein [Ascoidea rubescens DSM 1968]